MTSIFNQWSEWLESKLDSLVLDRRMVTSVSDNQLYPQVCLRAANNYRFFNRFRRNRTYNKILEGLTREEGLPYLDLVRKDPELFARLDLFRPNDLHGSPRVYDYGEAGIFSPTTLRYVKVLGDLKRLFGPLDGFDICEIGIGYGGQCRVINALFAPATYNLLDLQPALLLAQRFLDHFVLPSRLAFTTLNQLAPRSYDLLISNYAFTELPRPVQEPYLRSAVLQAKRGYITYNAINPAGFNSYTKEELLAFIPGSHAIPEEPLSHEGNCIIVWGDHGSAA